MLVAKRCKECPRRNDYCAWPCVGCVSVGEVFRYRQENFRRIGSLICAEEKAGIFRWKIQRLPDAVSNEMVGSHQNCIIVQREKDGCICFMECSLDLDGITVDEPCDGCRLYQEARKKPPADK